MSRTQSLAALQRDWDTLGDADPFWAVCVDRKRRGGGWDVSEFMASGRSEVGHLIAGLDASGLCPDRRAALDFGCGLGRLTAALAEHFETVTGVDISASMLRQATRLHASNPRCSFAHNDQPNLSSFGSRSFDLVYSSMVLQHLPAELAAAYLAEFVRIVRPGGAVAIFVPQSHRRTPSGLVYAHAPQRMIGLIQTRVFGYPAPMRMTTFPADLAASVVAPLGARLVTSLPRAGFLGHWRMATHVMTVDAAAGPAAEEG
jgi:SAM-dependent methyltransferase